MHIIRIPWSFRIEFVRTFVRRTCVLGGNLKRFPNYELVSRKVEMTWIKGPLKIQIYLQMYLYRQNIILQLSLLNNLMRDGELTIMVAVREYRKI